MFLQFFEWSGPKSGGANCYNIELEKNLQPNLTYNNRIRYVFLWWVEKLPKSETVHLHYQLQWCLQQRLLNANVKGILLWKTIVLTMQIVSSFKVQQPFWNIK